MKATKNELFLETLLLYLLHLFISSSPCLEETHAQIIKYSPPSKINKSNLFCILSGIKLQDQAPESRAEKKLHLSIRSELSECFLRFCSANVAKLNAKPHRRGSLFYFKLMSCILSLTDCSQSFFHVYEDGDVCGHIASTGLSVVQGRSRG